MSTALATFAVIATLGSQAADVDASSYCTKVRSRAKGDAALLLAPSVFAQILRYPLSMDLGPTSNDNVQLRIGLSYSPLDTYRGFQVMGLADADCLAFTSRTSLTQVLTDGLASVEAAAYRDQVRYLDANRGEWQALRKKARQRLDARVITLLEYEDFERRVVEIERKLEESRAAVARADARGATSPHPPILQQAHAYIDHQQNMDRIDSGLHRLQGLNLRLVGGAIPTLDGHLDWFGWVEASYNFGGLFQGTQERAYLGARQRELLDASYEYPARLEALHREAQALRDHGRRELDLVEQHLASLDRVADILGADATATAGQAIDSIAAERISAMSEQVYFRALVTELSTFLGND